MKFKILTPCNQCPFRSDSPSFNLCEGRSEEIIETLESGGTFQCHKTNSSNSQHCGGALIAVKKEYGGFHGMLSVACAIGLFDYKNLDIEADVLSFQEFIDRHNPN